MMCGRFTLHHTWPEISEVMDIVPSMAKGRNDPARYNIAPTQSVPFVHAENEGVNVSDGQWWLIPVWAKEQPKYPTFNARSETAHEKNSFKASFKSKRCLIPADGYYEWTKGEDGGKDPHFIHLPEHKPFLFAGLWAYNSHMDLKSCTILTAPADNAIKHIHDRMPIILQEEKHDVWLSKETEVDEAREILKSHRNGELESYRVSRNVNSSKSTGSDLNSAISI